MHVCVCAVYGLRVGSCRGQKLSWSLRWKQLWAACHGCWEPNEDLLEGQQVLLSWWSHTTYGAEVSFLSLLTSACSWETEFSLDCLHSDLSILPATFPKVHCLVTFSHASHHLSAFQSRLLFYIIQCFCILTWLPHENPPKLISKTGQARVKLVALCRPFTKYWVLWVPSLH